MQPRHGAVTLWIILSGPAFLALLVFVLEIANLWLARVELENALSATALAAVKEWGDAGGGDTLCPREVGLAYAAANTLVGESLLITNNYLPGQPNENASCDGNLIFGAIITQEPPFVFDAGVTPSCAAGSVVFDVTATQGSLDTGNHHEWGISFQPTMTLHSTLRIRRVVYILPETCSDGGQMIVPRFAEGSPNVSPAVTDCDPNNILRDRCPSGGGRPGMSGQADVFGIDRTSVTFYYDVDLNSDPCAIGNGRLIDATNTGFSRTMAIEFPDDPNNALLGFDLEDRIRFGARVRDTITNGQVGADEIGKCGTEVIICFNDGTALMGKFIDNNEKSNECLRCVGVAGWGSNTPLKQIDCKNPPTTAGNHGLIIHPAGIPDIPCPLASGNNNNGQSLVVIDLSGGGGGAPFAVRAQATVPVKSLFCELCGIPLGPFFVTAKETAVYDCQTRCPRLIKINPENFYCPEPAPPLP